jgi:hypothetical protein
MTDSQKEKEMATSFFISFASVKFSSSNHIAAHPFVCGSERYGRTVDIGIFVYYIYRHLIDKL